MVRLGERRIAGRATIRTSLHASDPRDGMLVYDAPDAIGRTEATEPAMRRGVVILGCALLAPSVSAEEWHGADASYIESVHQALHSRWSDFLTLLKRIPDPAYKDMTRSAEVEIVVEGDGAISGVQRTRGSGLPGFDDAPVEMITDVARLPPPPRELLSDDGRCHVRWTFTRAEPGCEHGEVLSFRLPTEEAIPRLVQTGRAPMAVARTVAALAEPIVAAGAPAREAMLARALGRSLAEAASKDPISARRRAAATVLGHFEDTRSMLLALAEDADGAVQGAALVALGSRKTGPDPEVREVLIAALNRGQSASAAIGLGHLGDVAAAPALRKALASGVAPEQTAAALVRLGDAAWATTAVKGFLAGKPHLRAVGAYGARGLMSEALVPAIVAAMKGAPDDARGILVEVLVSFPSAEARAAIMRALTDEAPEVRLRAFKALASFPEPHSATVRYHLADAIKDADPSVRAEVGALLVELSGWTAAEEIAALGRDPNHAVRASVAAALVAHPFAGSGKILDKLKHDADKAVQTALAGPQAREAPTESAKAPELPATSSKAPSKDAPAPSSSLADLARTSDEAEWLAIIDAALVRAEPPVKAK